MKPKLIFARAGYGKTNYLVKKIQENIKDLSQEIYVLVPKQYTLKAEYELMERLNLDGWFQIKIVSFENLVEKILKESKIDSQQFLELSGLGMLIRKAIEKKSKDLKIYQKISDKNGFIQELLDQFEDFEEIKKIKNSGEALDKNLNEKLNEINLIYEEAFSQIKEDIFTKNKKFEVAKSKIKNQKWIKNSIFMVDEFEGFTSIQREFLFEIIKASKEFFLTLTMDFESQKELEIFETTEFEYKELLKLENENMIEFEIINLNENKSNKPESIKHLEKYLFQYPEKIFKKNTNEIFISNYTNKEAEVESLAIEIINLIKNKTRFKDIAILIPDKDLYEGLIRRIFYSYEIPYFLDSTRELMTHPIVVSLLSLGKILTKNFAYEEVFRFLKLNFSPISQEKTELLENYILQRGYNQKDYFKEFEDERIEEIRKEAFLNIFKLHENLKSSKTVIEKINEILNYLDKENWNLKLQNWIFELKKEREFERVNENEQIWNVIMKVLDQMILTMKDQKISIKDFFNVLESGLKQEEIGILPATVDQILVADVQRSIIGQVENLFVLGMNEGIFPKFMSQKGLLSEVEKKIIKENGVRLESDQHLKYKKDKFSIYNKVNKAKTKIYFSYVLLDENAKSLKPSFIATRLERIFPYANKLEKNNKLKENIVHWKASSPYWIRAIKTDEDVEEVTAWYQNNENEFFEKLKEAMIKKNPKEYYLKEDIENLYKKPFVTSVSRLETYRKCPFSHFIKYGLKPKERKDFSIESPDIGNVFHMIIETFGNYLKEENLRWDQIDDDVIEKFMSNHFERMIKEFYYGIFYKTSRNAYKINQIKRVSKRSINTLKNQSEKDQFRPVGYEVGFSENDSLSSIIIELSDNQKVYVQGRIDRVDVFEDEKDSYIRIIDYKSGNKKLTLSDVYHGLQMQLMLYMNTLLNQQEDLNDKNLKPAGIFYFKIDDPMISVETPFAEVEEKILKTLQMNGFVLKDIKVLKAFDKDIIENKSSNIIPVTLNKNLEISSRSKVLTNDEFLILMNHIEEKIKELSIQILQGRVSVKPCKFDQSSACDFCDLKSICGFDEKILGFEFENIINLSDSNVLEELKKEEEGKNAKMDSETGRSNLYKK